MVLDTWSGVLKTSFGGLWNGVIMFIPNVVVALIILCIGWAVGAIVAKGIMHFMKMIKFDEALKQAGFEGFVRRAGLNLNSGMFLGSIVKYFIIVAFLIASFDVLGLTQVTIFLDTVVLKFLPTLIVTVLVLMVGGVVGDVLSRIVRASARTANLSSANALATIAKWAVWIFAILVALSQMQIAADLIKTLFQGIITALSLGLGLAFGLGGQAAASRTIDKVSSNISSHHN